MAKEGRRAQSHDERPDSTSHDAQSPTNEPLSFNTRSLIFISIVAHAAAAAPTNPSRSSSRRRRRPGGSTRTRRRSCTRTTSRASLRALVRSRVRHETSFLASPARLSRERRVAGASPASASSRPDVFVNSLPGHLRARSPSSLARPRRFARTRRRMRPRRRRPRRRRAMRRCYSPSRACGAVDVRRGCKRRSANATTSSGAR